MNDLKKRFLSFQEKNPCLGSVVIMSMAVEGLKYSKDTIRRAFNSLVPLDEYEQDEKNEIIESLTHYSQNSTLVK